MISGIYIIQCIVNGKCYIGQSINVDIRLKEHFRKLKTNKHNNVKLQNAWNKYEESAFINFKCINCPIEELDSYEKFYIQLLDSVSFGYNIETGGNCRKIISEESKLKMSTAKKGKSNKLKGRKLSDELRLKLSLAHKGLPSPKKGIPTGKPAWNKGIKGVQDSTRRIKIEAFDALDNKFMGIFESKAHFFKHINYKSKNFIKISNDITKVGRYILKSI